MIVVLLRTKPSGLYRHRRGLGLHRVGLQRRRSTSESPSLPSTPRRVPPGHGTKSSILYLHSPTVRSKYIVRLSGYPLIQDSLTYLIRSINGLPCSGPNNSPYEIWPVKSLPCSGPNYGPDKIRPFKRLWAKLWPISDSAHQLDAILLGPLAKGPFSNSAWY